MAESYLGQLQNLERGLESKESSYGLEIDLGEQYLKELEGIKGYVTELKVNHSEERENCECSIY